MAQAPESQCFITCIFIILVIFHERQEQNDPEAAMKSKEALAST